MKRLALVLLPLLVTLAVLGDNAPPEKKYYADLDVFCRAPQRLVESVKQRLAAQSAAIRARGVQPATTTPYAREINQTKIFVLGVRYAVSRPTKLSALQAAHALLADCLDDMNVTGPEASLRLHGEPESLLGH